MEKEVPEVERRFVLKKIYSDKIDFLLSQEIDDKSFYEVIRKFFSDYLKLNYEFTYEELSQELNKIFIKQSIKSKIDSLLEDLSYYEYFYGELSQEKKKEILLDFKNIINELITEYTLNVKKSFFEKLFDIPKQIVSKSKKNDFRLENDFTDNLLNPANNNSNTTFNTAADSRDIVDVSVSNNDGNVINKYDMSLNNENKKETKGEFNFIGSENNELLNDKNNVLNKDYNKNYYKEKLNQKDQNMLLLSDDYSNNDANSIKNFYDNKNNNMNFLLLEDNDPELLVLKELMEESYFYLNSGKIEQAKKSYMIALKVYDKLDFYKKNIVYLDLYELYNRLNISN